MADLPGHFAGWGIGFDDDVMASITAVLMVGFVARFGVPALAGYSIGVRLEAMIAPVSFGIGSGLTTMVGVAAGAGHGNAR